MSSIQGPTSPINIFAARGGRRYEIAYSVPKIPAFIRQKFGDCVEVEVWKNIGSRPIDDDSISTEVIEGVLLDMVKFPHKFRPLSSPQLPLADITENGLFGKRNTGGEKIKIHISDRGPELVIVSYMCEFRPEDSDDITEEMYRHAFDENPDAYSCVYPDNLMTDYYLYEG
jgi:hypothetical protein